MKTKSKRFLNLATLCLALLGTTLLMGRPVKAEATVIGQEQRSATETPGSQTDDTEVSKYFEGRKKGYDEGYEAGSKLGAPNPKELGNQVHDPEHNPYDSNKTDKEDYRSGYSDAYGEGYVAGWHAVHPITSFIEMTLEFLTSIFSWFGGGQ
ncbi:Uncharacterised protein [Streptococcus pyogenes]|uniref:hypothetical protein n=1 Tax=Streptococcus pyogenes TaxID=1314 RepID=UPI0010A18BF7|nr:hypothetical protein [Streptococcus pyogenes]VHC41891.1 Uncharacterised protein [Streptococcus pyogenes]